MQYQQVPLNVKLYPMSGNGSDSRNQLPEMAMNLQKSVWLYHCAERGLDICAMLHQTEFTIRVTAR